MLYVLGTAGMRLLSDEDQRVMVAHLTMALTEEYPFHLPQDGVQVISGQLEGACVCVCVCVCVCARVCVHALVDVCVRACMHVYLHVTLYILSQVVITVVHVHVICV